MKDDNEMQRSQPMYADATIDICFKKLLSDFDIAKDIISSITGLKITKIFPRCEYLPPSNAEKEPESTMVFDVSTEFYEYIVRIQNYHLLDEETVFYLAGTLSYQLCGWEYSPIKRYHKLKKTIAIQFLDFDTQVRNPMKDDQYIRDYVFSNKSSGKVIDILQLIQIDLPKANRILNLTPDNAQNFQDTREKSNMKWWLSLLSNAREYEKKDIVAAPDIIQKGFEMLEYSKWNTELQSQYLDELKTKNKDRSQYELVCKKLAMKDEVIQQKDKEIQQKRNEIEEFRKKYIKDGYKKFCKNNKMLFSKRLKQMQEEYDEDKNFGNKVKEFLFNKKANEDITAGKTQEEQIESFVDKIRNAKIEDCLDSDSEMDE